MLEAASPTSPRFQIPWAAMNSNQANPNRHANLAVRPHALALGQAATMVEVVVIGLVVADLQIDRNLVTLNSVCGNRS